MAQQKSDIFKQKTDFFFNGSGGLTSCQFYGIMIN